MTEAEDTEITFFFYHIFEILIQVTEVFRSCMTNTNVKHT